MEAVTDPSDLETAWSEQYDRLARVVAGLLGRKHRRMAEIGCGRGQLTIPLAKRARNLRFVLVDRFVGASYSRDYRVL